MDNKIQDFVASPLGFEEYLKLIDEEKEAQYIKMFSEPITMDKLDFDPIVYNNEPWQISESIQELLDNWLAILNCLREDYLSTKDERYARILLDLVPAGVYSKYC